MYQSIFRRIFIIASLFFVPLVTYAKMISNQGKYKYNQGYIVLSGAKPRIYLFKNISGKRVVVDREQRFNPGASAGWASLIIPGRWSAILMNQPQFKINCMTKTKRNVFRKVCCKHWIKVIVIKKFTAKRSSLIDGGSFWIA